MISATFQNLRKVLQKNIVYDLILYISVGLHLALLCIFLFLLKDSSLQIYEVVGRVFSMGLVTFAINLAHELGHRQSWGEQFLSKLMLLTTLMMHFFIEHNRGHHKIATFEDPSTARKGETVYALVGQYSMNISARSLKRKGLKRPNRLIIACITR